MQDTHAYALLASSYQAVFNAVVPPQVKKAAGDVVSYSIDRPVRRIPSPVTSQLDVRHDGRRVGVIGLSSFNARAQRDLAAAVTQLQAQGATDFVLDLRDNRSVIYSYQQPFVCRFSLYVIAF